MRKFIYSLFLLLLVSCGSTAVKDSAVLVDVQRQLEATQQQQAQLEKKLDALVEVQQVANDDIKSELAKTRDLVDQRVSRQPTQTTSTNSQTRSSQPTKAEWLAKEGKVLIGGIESITFTGPDLTYAARIDTGATSSSLDARDVTRFERDGDRWVRFKLYMDDDHTADVERPIVRLVRVFTSGTEEGERRPVVEMAYRFGNIEDTAEFTLTDRSHLEFATLIGRNIITDRMIVDVSDSYIFSD